MGTPSEVQIVNVGLALIGEPPITSLADQRKAAQVMDLLYDDTRDALLRDYDWRFARERETLAQSADAPPFGYSAKFALPSEFIALRQINLRDYEIEGLFVLTSEGGPVELVYTRREEDPTKMDPSFRRALSALLAREGAIAITGRREMYELAASAFEDAIRMARFHGSIETPPRVIESDDFELARWAGLGTFRPISDTETPIP